MLTDEQLRTMIEECNPATNAMGWEAIAKDSLWRLGSELLALREASRDALHLIHIGEVTGFSAIDDDQWEVIEVKLRKAVQLSVA
jgi:hypothetical protein